MPPRQLQKKRELVSKTVTIFVTVIIKLFNVETNLTIEII